MFGFCCEVRAIAGDLGRTLENITNGNNKGACEDTFQD